MLASLFVNHDQTKIQVAEPIILNLSLFFVFSFLILISCRKTIDDRPLSILQTNQMKGLAIIVIILAHLSIYTLEKSNVLQGFYAFSAGGVALFLIISGFGLSISIEKKGIENFFSKRVIRVVVPLVFAMLMEIFLNHMLLHKKSNFLLDIAEIFFNISNVDRNMWFIVFILFWYCLTNLVFRLNLSNQTKIIFLCSVSTVFVVIPQIPVYWKANALSFPLGYWLGLNSRFVVERFNDLLSGKIATLMSIITPVILLVIPTKIVFLILGIAAVAHLIFVLKINVKFNNPIETISLCLTIVIVSFNYLGWVFDDIIIGKHHNIVWSIVNSLTAIFYAASMCSLVSLLVKFKRASLFLSFVGENSFELYLLHGMFMYSFDFILFRGNVAVTFFVYFLAICLASIVLRQLSSITSDSLLKRFNA